MLLQIEQADYLGNYRFKLKFNDGKAGIADIHPLLESKPKEIFSPLSDERFVRRFTLDHATLCWPGELDVAAEYFYFLAFRDDHSLRQQFIDWGYLPNPSQLPV